MMAANNAAVQVVRTVTHLVVAGVTVNSATQLVSYIKTILPNIGILIKMELVESPTIDNQFVKYDYDSDFKVTSTRYKTGSGTASEFTWNSSTISVVVKPNTTYEISYIPDSFLN